MHMTPNYMYITLQQTYIFLLNSQVTLLSDIYDFVTNNRLSLRLHANKTDFIILGVSIQSSKLTHFFTLSVLNHIIHIHNLDFTSDSIFLYLRKHISTSLIISSLRYYHSLLYYITANDITKLYCIQNCLTSFMTLSHRLSHSMSLPKSLY